jgi:hypothetical protein
MVRRKSVILAGIAILTFLAAQNIFAEDTGENIPDSVVIAASQKSVAQNGTDLQWVWGEIVNLEEHDRTITLEYLDYEVDQEKKIVLSVDQDTVFENVKGFTDLKPKDTLSVDYLAGPDNVNIAKNISLDKPEDLAAVSPSGAAAADSISSDSGGTVAEPAVEGEMVRQEDLQE